MRQLASFVATRVVSGVALLVVVTFLSFMAMALLPGDPASAVLGRASPERLEQFRQEFGLDRSALAQYGDWAGGAVRGDLGQSYASDSEVWSLLWPRLQNSLILGVTAAALVVTFGIALGTGAGRRIDSRFDRTSTVVSISLTAIPEFALGTFLAYLLGIYWDIFPAVALFPLDDGPLSRPSVLVLPVLTLVLLNVGYQARLVRANVAEALQSPAVTQARLNGETERYVTWRVALPAALPATLQASALLFVYLIGGLVVTEAVFQYEGIGLLGVNAAISRDFPVVQGVTVATTALYLIVVALVEAGVILVTPRLRTAS